MRSFGDALAIRRHLEPGKRIAIIGGGFIGLELAASAVKRGATVTVIEALPRVLMRGVPEEIAAIVTARHRSEGAEILCGTGIRSIDGDADEVRITLADGRTVAADLAVIGIGAMPVTGLAEQAGLLIENGISVDRCLQTSDPDDICRRRLLLVSARHLWRPARPAGILAQRDRTRARWRQRTCSAPASRFRPCRGSGRISMT